LHCTAGQLLIIVMLLCCVLHVTPVYPTFLFSLRLSFVLIVLINYITRYVASLMSVCFSGSLPAYSCI